MISFNVFGCCVSRDALALLEEQNKICVLQTVSSTTTISAFSEKPEHIFTPEDFKDYSGTNFHKRITIQDLNKTSLDYLFEKKADYLIVDLMNNRLTMYKKKQHYFSIGNLYNANRERFDRDIRIGDYEKVRMEDLSFDDYKESLDKLCSVILKNYSPHRIIVNRIHGSLSFLSENYIVNFSRGVENGVRNYNRAIDEQYDYIISKLKGCHIINPPDNIISDRTHRWGVHPLRFHNFYYLYCGKAIETICKDMPYAEETEYLEELRQIYSDKFELLQNRIMLENEKNKSIWAECAMKSVEDLLLDSYTNKYFCNILKTLRNENKKVAVIKANSVLGKVIVEILNSNSIDITLATPVQNLENINASDMEKLRKADFIIDANSLHFSYIEYGGLTAVSVNLLLSGNYKIN